ncbi:MAG: adenylosuccinate lyase [Bacillota bacterium]|nr:adenylosuccinate lyase [Bacillota bacterium]
MDPRYIRPEMGVLWSDKARLERWQRVEAAAARASAEAGVIPAEAARAIAAAPPVDPEAVQREEAVVQHDLIAFTTVLARSLGEAGRWLHYGLTSNDVKDTALGLALRDAVDLLLEDLERLRLAVAAEARRHRETLMAGRTHGMLAEPITFGVKLAGWHAELLRHRERLRRAREEVAVGKLSGAVGVFGFLPPEVEERAMALLGLRAEPVATQVVARDRLAALAGALITLAGGVERFALEIRHLQRSELGELFEPFRGGQKGSSAMPHKRNPEKAERLTGLARLVRNEAAALFEDQALWHERDISHSSVERVVLPDLFEALDYALTLLRQLVEGWEVQPGRMRRNLEAGGGLIASERVLLALVEAGWSRERAYEHVQRAAFRAWERGDGFRAELEADAEVRAALDPSRLDRLFDPRAGLGHVDQLFRRAGIEAE